MSASKKPAASRLAPVPASDPGAPSRLADPRASDAGPSASDAGSTASHAGATSSLAEPPASGPNVAASLAPAEAQSADPLPDEEDAPASDPPELLDEEDPDAEPVTREEMLAFLSTEECEASVRKAARSRSPRKAGADVIDDLSQMARLRALETGKLPSLARPRADLDPPRDRQRHHRVLEGR